MARKKDSPIGVGMTAKQMKRKRPINADLLNKASKSPGSRVSKINT